MADAAGTVKPGVAKQDAARPNIRRVGVVAKRGSREAAHMAGELIEWLERRGIEARPDPDARRALRRSGEAFGPGDPADLVVSMGGDGTLLSVARNLAEGVPLLGINLGSLGFLTEIARGELYPGLVEVLGGRFRLETRSLLRVDVARHSGERLAFRAFNDAVIAKGVRSRIIDLHVVVDGMPVANYRADGLILSTPTGSTAYNLSAAGPILHPLLPVTVLTPICPHTLSLRPVVLPDTSTIEVTLETEHEEVFLTVDGQESATFEHRDRLRITRHPVEVNLVKISSRSFYDSLRGKLRWGALTEGGGSRP